MINFRVTGTVPSGRPSLAGAEPPTARPPGAATARVFFRAAGGFVDTATYQGAALRPGHSSPARPSSSGWATPSSSRPGVSGSVDPFGNVVLRREQ